MSRLVQKLRLGRDGVGRFVLLSHSRASQVAAEHRTSQQGCHTLWVLGHLAYIEALVIRKFMLGGSNPLAHWEEMFDGTEVSGKTEDFVPFDCALAECRATRASTISLLESLDEDDLDQTSASAPNGTDGLFGTYRRCFQYAADHWFMHRGQLADARRVAGLDRMWY